MERKELHEYISEFEDSNSDIESVQALKDELISRVEALSVESSERKHLLNKVVRELEEELEWIENEKLPEFEPEQE
ncbi:MAG: hypothetical protein ABEJ93_02845 [Candidatus Nanohalobium sp.]